MKEITVISGKGGTGKTSFAGSFAALSNNAVFTDCDVDAANLSLIMRPVLQETHEFKASREAFIREEQCSRCGLCRELCRFGAISEDFQVNSLSCEGCGLCYHACPEKAIDFAEVVSGKWFISQTPYGPLVHARLGVAEENSGKLV
ncbi:MAG: 4Fe-4S binding protein, partial [Bacillota bacterium]|nr:4Fe-4S binding protein [Bacillota bacterium]